LRKKKVQKNEKRKNYKAMKQKKKYSRQTNKRILYTEEEEEDLFEGVSRTGER